MHLFENWWERAPLYLRAALLIASVVGLLFGRPVDAYWE
jgi:hypothetical protein